MSENKKLELLDQYDDVTFALLMDEYAEEEGARLRKEFEEAQAAGEVSDTSDALDEKCIQMIHRDFAKKRGKENVRKIIRMSTKVAVAVMVFLGVAATTIMSVDAFRNPFIDFLISQTNNSSIIHFDEVNNEQSFASEAIDFPSSLIPEGYSEVYSEMINDLPSCMYMNANGNIILFDVTPTEGKFAFDSEDATVKEIVFLDYAAIYICKDMRLQLLWFDEEKNITFNCTSDGLTEDDFFSLCENLTHQYIGIGE